MKDAVFKTYVRGIYCVECPEKIIFGLLQTRGVVDADVAYFQSLVTVKYDPALVSEETLREVLKELGYPFKNGWTASSAPTAPMRSAPV